MRSPQKTLALWAMLVVVAILLFQMYEAQRQTLIRDFDYPKFLKALEASEVESVTFNKDSGEIEGDIKNDYRDKYKGRHFQILGNVDSEGFKLVRENGITPKYVGSDNSFMSSVFFSWLPLIVIIGMMMFFMRQIQVGGERP